MLSSDWFFNEFGFGESEITKLKNLKDLISFDSSNNNKFNVFSSTKNGKTFYPGRFDCFTNEYLSSLLEDLRLGKSTSNLKDFCLSDTETDEKPLVQSKISEKEESGVIQEQPLFSKEFQEELSKKLIFGFKEQIPVKSLVYLKKKNSKEEYANEGAVFQVASQFNCLEMVGPSVTPRHGITNYILDQTQGPECALCCRPALFYRNYLVKMDKSIGQLEYQINLLDELERLLNNDKNGYWYVQNGYCLTKNAEKVKELNNKITGNEKPLKEEVLASKLKVLDKKNLEKKEDIKSKDKQSKKGLKEEEIESGLSKMEEPKAEGGPLDTKILFDPAEIIKKTKVGIHWDTEVSEWNASSTSNFGKSLPNHRISQVFCSTLAIAYDTQKSQNLKSLWGPFCRLLLQGQYEAILVVAGILAFLKQRRLNVYLTAVGGGVFGNSKEWIKEAIQTSINKHRDLPLNVYLVSFTKTPSVYTGIKVNQSSKL